MGGLGLCVAAEQAQAAQEWLMAVGIGVAVATAAAQAVAGYVWSGFSDMGVAAARSGCGNRVGRRGGTVGSSAAFVALIGCVLRSALYLHLI